MANEVIVKGDLEAVPGKILQQLRFIMAKDEALLQTHVKEKYFTGFTGPSSLRNRTGKLRNSVRPVLPVAIEAMAVKGGLIFGTQYAASHVGPKGQKKTIRAKSGKALAIPMTWIPESRRVLETARGGLRGGPLSSFFKDSTFVKKSKAGNAIIFAKASYQKGARAGQAKGGLLPLFLLRKQVQIPYRIHPTDLFKWFADKFAEDIRGKGIVAHVSTY